MNFHHERCGFPLVGSGRSGRTGSPRDGSGGGGGTNPSIGRGGGGGGGGGAPRGAGMKGTERSAYISDC